MVDFNNMLPQGGYQRIILISALAIGLAIIAYIIYSRMMSVSTGVFNANREHDNEENGDDGKKEANLIFFYADWCPHCKVAKPEWDALVEQNEGKIIGGYKVIYTEYNCAKLTPELESLLDKYNVKGYPTIKLVKDGQSIDYDAKPTTSTLNQFLSQVL